MAKIPHALGFAIAALCVLAEGSNILGIFHYPSKSHHILGETLLKGLVKRGHNVTMISPFAASEASPNYTHLEIRDLLKCKEESFQTFFQGQMSFLQTLAYVSVFERLTPALLDSKPFQTLLRSNSTFDAVIMMIGITDVLLGMADHFNAPVVGFATVGGFTNADNLMGNPSPYAYVPNALSPYSDDMGFMERVINTLYGLSLTLLQQRQLRQQARYLAEYFPASPPIEDLIENISLVLVNSHISTETPRPYLPNVIQIGGFHIQEPEDLPEDLQRLLDASPKGVIYFSFGTNVRISQLPPRILAAFVEAFKRTQLEVLWKHEGDDGMLEISKNVHFKKWLPQRGVLAHKNLKVFITHGGLGSISEALYYGIPLVCIPFFGDQEKNCGDIVRYGIGKQLAFDEITTDLLQHTLDEILDDARYAANVKLRSELYREQPMKPMDKVAYWVEYVIKYKGAKHLRAHATKLAWYQLLLLDVTAFLITVFLTTFLIFFYVVRISLRKLTQKTSRKRKTN